MSKALEFRLSGSGGQGLILAGIILSEAALFDGKNAVQSQSYGPEARGGASKAEVIISEDTIDYPKVARPLVLLCLTDEAYRKYGGDVDPSGVIVVDSSMSRPAPDEAVPAEIHRLPILSTARETVGQAMTANIVALGCLNGLTRAVTQSSLEKAVAGRVPSGTAEINLKALRAGTACVTGSGASE